MSSKTKKITATDYACRGIMIGIAIKTVIKRLMSFQPDKEGKMLLAIRHVQSTRKLVRTHKTQSYYLA